MGDCLSTRRSNARRARRRTRWRVFVPWVLLPALVFPLAALRADEPPASELADERPAAERAEEPPAFDTPVESGEAPLFSVGPLQYRPGRGLRVGATGFVIGGFTNLKVERGEGQGAEFDLDLLNFFLIFDRFTRFRAVAELQLKDIFVADTQRAGTQDFAFDVRRLFGDFIFSDQLRLRAGTFLTPVGYWNLLLAPPLTWTTEAPLIIEDTFFQQTTTGLMLHGSTAVANGQFGYSLFSQFLKPLEDDPDLAPPDHTLGLRLTYSTGPAWSVGASYQGSETDGAWSQLGDLFFLWQHRRGEILGEFLYQDGDALRSPDGETLSFPQWGTYLQGVLDLWDPLFLVGRYEYYDQPSPNPTLNLFTIGAVFKPLPFMAVKVEYRVADRSSDDSPAGFFSSFTTFF